MSLTSSAKEKQPLSFLDFFAGSGLVTLALKYHFKPLWANDICEKKMAVYTANHGAGHFHLGEIEKVKGDMLPEAHLSWASFPCQDLSLAGKMGGLSAERSGLLWEWLRILDESAVRPKLLAIENVVGLVSVGNGEHYRELHKALRLRGYKAGAVILNASMWVPQSRPRVFIVAVPKDFDTLEFETPTPRPWLHSLPIQRAASGLDDFVFWKFPRPAPRKSMLGDILDSAAVPDPEEKAKHVLSLIPPSHQNRLLQELTNGFKAAPGYRRIRDGKQVLELRFDGIAGCLRTPKGGSSRQVIVERRNGVLKTRLLTVREAARLMGVPDTYQIPGGYNDGYKAMGDAVAVPAVRALGEHLLKPLAEKLYE